MPCKQVVHRKSLKTLCLETLVFIGLVTVVGHVGMSLWDRYVIQRDLNHIKSSLNILKETVNGISNAYDNLNVEVKDLSLLTDNNSGFLDNSVNKWKITAPKNNEKNINWLQNNNFYRRNFQQQGNEKSMNDKNKKSVVTKNAAVTVKPVTFSIGVSSEKNKANEYCNEYCIDKDGYRRVGYNIMAKRNCKTCGPNWKF